ncbi:hypothetical protein R1sor_009597 [Riccia sorocarpa]|uniref:Uncharacterized protein n=1 Tax=Riccia sorocarpa TaxID=122646 RepID=A0ABD3HX31_9MARC
MSRSAVEIWKDQVVRLIRWGEKNQKTDHSWRRLNGEEKSEREPFVIDGDVKREPCYSWIFRKQNFTKVARILGACKRHYGIVGDVPVMLAEDETRIKPRVRWEARRDSLIGFCGEKSTHTCSLGLEMQVGSVVGPIIGHASDGDSRRREKVPLHMMGSDCCEHFFSRVGGMSGYERNYDFGDLIACASGLNRIAWMEYGEENISVGRSHVKQQTIWGKLHPLQPGEVEPNLADFNGLESDGEVVTTLLSGLREAQNLLTQLNMAPHHGVRDQAWWKTPWQVEADLKVFGSSSTVENEASDSDGEIVEATDREPECSSWDMSLQREVPDPDPEVDDGDDGADDLSVVGHETRHVLAEVLQQVQAEGASVSKYDPMVVYEGHSIYKATLVSQLLGNPTLSKDRLTRIKQSIYFNGVKPKPRQDGVPVCIMDIGSDCAVLFNTVSNKSSTRAKKGRRATTTMKEVWIGHVQKIRRKYNGKWGKTRSEIDLLDRPVVQAGEGCSCQVLFTWYKPLNNSTVKYLYECTDLQWIDLESVITVVTMKVEQNVRSVWHLDPNDRVRIDEFMASV